ncbi:glycosyltransferase family 2 protein [Anaerostipes faecalis]|uniref:glycosyltransferase family 2 protein n=1 Tax=Anaerostipes faecalis TaxID=2738446 RepID=UPI003F10764A
METKKPKVSVIVPVYNCEKYIERCIRSLKRQTEINFEVLIINDGSTDTSESECIKAIDGDTRFFLYKKNNSGVSAARNYGLDKAKGNNIIFVDSDDWIPNDYIEKLLEAKQGSKAEIICCGFVSTDGVKVKNTYKLKEKNMSQNEALDQLSPYYYSAVWGKLFDRSVLENIKFNTNFYFSEDSLFYTQALLKCNRVLWCDKTSYNYFDNTSGAMRTKNPDKFFTDFLARKEILAIYISNNIRSIGAEYWLLDSALNVKKIFYSNNIFGDSRIDELNETIKTYRWKFLKNLKQQLKILYLSCTWMFKIKNNLFEDN